MPKADVTIGVNRACIAFACDWWAAADYCMIRDNRERLLGNPRLLSRRQTVADLHGRLNRFPQIRTFEEITTIPRDLGWGLKTMTAAIAFAADLGATKINVHGYDGKGELDYDGVKAGEERTEARWRDEAMTFDRLRRWLNSNNCEVIRHVERF